MIPRKSARRNGRGVREPQWPKAHGKAPGSRWNTPNRKRWQNHAHPSVPAGPNCLRLPPKGRACWEGAQHQRKPLGYQALPSPGSLANDLSTRIASGRDCLRIRWQRPSQRGWPHRRCLPGESVAGFRHASIASMEPPIAPAAHRFPWWLGTCGRIGKRNPRGPGPDPPRFFRSTARHPGAGEFSPPAESWPRRQPGRSPRSRCWPKSNWPWPWALPGKPIRPRVDPKSHRIARERVPRPILGFGVGTGFLRWRHARLGWKRSSAGPLAPRCTPKWPYGCSRSLPRSGSIRWGGCWSTAPGAVGSARGWRRPRGLPGARTMHSPIGFARLRKKPRWPPGKGASSHSNRDRRVPWSCRF